MKIWHRIYFGDLANYENPPKLNSAELSFYYPMHVKYNSIHQYKIRQSLKND